MGHVEDALELRDRIKHIGVKCSRDVDAVVRHDRSGGLDGSSERAG